MSDGRIDHNYATWDGLLKKYVHWLPDNKQSRVDYTGFAQDRDALRTLLANGSTVTPTALAAFSSAQQMAFLINAYNGFTRLSIEKQSAAVVRECGTSTTTGR